MLVSDSDALSAFVTHHPVAVTLVRLFSLPLFFFLNTLLLGHGKKVIFATKLQQGQGYHCLGFPDSAYAIFCSVVVVLGSMTAVFLQSGHGFNARV